MDERNILLTCIKMLYLDNVIGNDGGDEIVIETIESMVNKKKLLSGGDTAELDDLKDYAIRMVSAYGDGSYDINDIEQSLLMILEKHIVAEKLVTSLKVKDLDLVTSQASRMRAILHRFVNEKVFVKTVSQYSYDLNTKVSKIPNLDEYRLGLIKALEQINLGGNRRKKGIISSLDLSDTATLSKAIGNIQNEANNGDLLKFGFQKMNELIGGIRRGELLTVTGVRFGYKSGFARSLFMQTMLHNAPPKGIKKPLMLYISFEDPERLCLKFMYEYLSQMNGTRKRITEVNNEQAAVEISKAFSERGWNFQLLVVNPSEWTYKDVFSEIAQWEMDGYEVYGVLMDYVSLLPKTGCTHSGSTGSDLRDLFRRFANWAKASNIFIITPHQSSPGAKQLLRDGVQDKDLVQTLYGKSYYEGSSQIDQEHDIGVLIHKVNMDDGAYIMLGVDKHKGHILDPDDSYITYKFPKHFPIVGDFGTKDKSVIIGEYVESQSMF